MRKQTGLRALVARVCTFILVTTGLAFAGSAQAAIEASITASPDPISGGDEVHVRILISNSGASAVAAVTADAEFPSNLNIIGAANIYGGGTCPGGSCTAGEFITWNLGTLQAGETRTFGYWATVPTSTSTPPDGTVIPFEVDALAGAVLQDSDSTSVTVQSSRVLEIAIRDTADPAVKGQQFNYVLTYGNASTVTTVTGTTMTLDLPGGVTFVSATGGGVFGSGQVSWSLGTLTPGAGGEQSVTVSVDLGELDASLQRADATIGGTGSGAATATEITEVQGTARQLEVAMTVDRNPVGSNEILSFEIVLTNSGTTDVTALTLAAPYPNRMTTLAPAAISDGGACNNTTCTSGELVTWSLGTLAAGKTRVVRMFPRVASSSLAPNDGTVIPFSIEARTSGGWGVRAGRNVLVETDAVLELALQTDADPAAPGDELTYTLTYGNQSDFTTAPGATIGLELPAGVTFVSASAGGGFDGDRSVSWPVGTVTPGQTGTVQATVSVGAGLDSGTLLLAEAAIKDGAVPQNARRRSLATSIETGSPLELEVEVLEDPVTPGRYVLLKMTAANTGLVDVFNVEAELRYPRFFTTYNPIFTLPPAICAGTTCTESEGLLWQLGTLSAGDAVTMMASLPTSTSTLAAPDGTVIDFYASLKEGLGNGARSRQAVVTDTEPVLEVSVASVLDPVPPADPANPQSTLVYVVSFGNQSGFVVTPTTTLVLEMPEEVTSIVAGGGGIVSGNTVTWTLGNLSPGVYGRRIISAQVPSGTADGTLLRADATISDVAMPQNAARASAVTRVQTDDVFGLTLDLEQIPVAPGENLGADVTVTNRSTSDLFGVAVDLFIPHEVTLAVPGNVMDSGSCNGTTCQNGEFITWNIGTLPAGQGRTVRANFLTRSSTQAPPDGSLITFDARVRDGLGNDMTVRDSTAVATNRLFDVFLTEDMDSAAANGLLNYEVKVGNRTAGNLAPNASLVVGLPAGTSFVSASDDVTVQGNSLIWPLGAVAPGLSGEGGFTVKIDPALEDGDIAKAGFLVLDGSVPTRESRALASTRLEAAAPVSLEVRVTPDEAQPGQQVVLEYSVTNNSGSTLFGINIDASIPDWFNTIFQSTDLDNGGTCSGTTCVEREFANWQIASLPARRTETVTMRATLRTSGPAPNGTLIRFDAYARDGLGRQATGADVLRIGTPLTRIPTFDGDLDASLTDIAGIGDITGNGAGDFAVLFENPATGNKIVNIYDGRNTALIRNTPMGPERALSLSVLPDMNSDGFPEIGVFFEGSLFAKVKNANNGALISSVFFDPRYEPFANIALNDVDGDGSPELANLGRFRQAGLVQMQAKEASNASLQTITGFDKFYRPFGGWRLDSVAGTAADEVAVFGVDRLGRVRAQVKDGLNGNLISLVYFDKRYAPLRSAALRDGSGALRWVAVLGVDNDGVVRGQVKDAQTGALGGIVRFDSDLEPRFFLGVEDVTTNGSPELVMAGRDASGVVFAQVKDIATGALINRIRFDSRLAPVAMAEIEDVDSSGANELALLGVTSTGDLEVQLKDLVTGKIVTQFPIP